MSVVPMREYLRERFEYPVPNWLYRGDFTLENFFRSRTIFYPGAGNDGHAIATFNASRTAYCFIYVDYGYDPDTLPTELTFPGDLANTIRTRTGRNPDGFLIELTPTFLRFRGDPVEYPRDLLGNFRNLTIQWLRGYRWLRLERLNPAIFQVRGAMGGDQSIWFAPLGRRLVEPFVLLAIYERLPQFGDDHGGERIAVLFVRAEANRLYRRLYAQLFPENPPFAVLLQDHGLGGNPPELRFRNPAGPMG